MMLMAVFRRSLIGVPLFLVCACTAIVAAPATFMFLGFVVPMLVGRALDATGIRLPFQWAFVPEIAMGLGVVFWFLICVGGALVAVFVALYPFIRWLDRDQRSHPTFENAANH
jgi:hypothetical protein